jgi:hypothetical protein
MWLKSLQRAFTPLTSWTFFCYHFWQRTVTRRQEQVA